MAIKNPKEEVMQTLKPQNMKIMAKEPMKFLSRMESLTKGKV